CQPHYERRNRVDLHAGGTARKRLAAPDARRPLPPAQHDDRMARWRSQRKCQARYYAPGLPKARQRIQPQVAAPTIHGLWIRPGAAAASHSLVPVLPTAPVGSLQEQISGPFLVPVSPKRFVVWLREQRLERRRAVFQRRRRFVWLLLPSSQRSTTAQSETP